ncbi:MAG: hypothetical protein WC518_02955 [Patescibacteria group bacterium]
MPEQDILNRLEEDIQYAKATEYLVKQQESSLEKLLKDNLKYSQAIYADTQKIRRYLFWRTVISVVWIMVVILPIIAAAIWLPPLFKNFYQSYQELLGGGQGTLDLLSQLKQLR